ncbi:probable serine/threonine-protein kinase clkA [Copidosoma floridanum]|uniref:probable serine/threonine-protein kinase clkA n=1 Tax=Copidosoma floridanum TaxID=29053 RepID=UPI0006C9631F|nr:probable serine/threonine-protein kinase clkA [Copidosoma floridanum]
MVRMTAQMVGPYNELFFLGTLASRLKEKAAEHFAPRLAPFEIVQEFLRELSRRYGSINNADTLMAQLKIIRQQSRESIEDYSGRVQGLYNRLTMLHDSSPSLFPIQKQVLKESAEAEAVKQFTYDLQPTGRNNKYNNYNNYNNYNRGYNNGPSEPYNRNDNYYNINNNYNTGNNGNSNYNNRNANYYDRNDYNNWYNNYNPMGSNYYSNRGYGDPYNNNNGDASNRYGNDYTNQDSRDGYNRNFVRPGPPQDRRPPQQRNIEYDPDNRRDGSAALNSQDVWRGPQTPSMN